MIWKDKIRSCTVCIIRSHRLSFRCRHWSKSQSLSAANANRESVSRCLCHFMQAFPSQKIICSGETGFGQVNSDRAVFLALFHEGALKWQFQSLLASVSPVFIEPKAPTLQISSDTPPNKNDISMNSEIMIISSQVPHKFTLSV